MKDAAAPSSENATGDGNPRSGDGWRARQAANQGVISGLGFGAEL